MLSKSASKESDPSSIRSGPSIPSAANCNGVSFPSGHTQNAAAGYFAIGQRNAGLSFRFWSSDWLSRVGLGFTIRQTSSPASFSGLDRILEGIFLKKQKGLLKQILLYTATGLIFFLSFSFFKQMTGSHRNSGFLYSFAFFLGYSGQSFGKYVNFDCRSRLQPGSRPDCARAGFESSSD